MAYTYDDWLKEQNKDSLSFKDAMKAGGTKERQKMIKGNEAKVKGNGKGWQKDGGLLGKGGNVKTGSALSTAAKAASAIADMSPSKWHGPVDAGTPVQQNEGGKKKGQTSETEYDNQSPIISKENISYENEKKKKKLTGTYYD